MVTNPARLDEDKFKTYLEHVGKSFLIAKKLNLPAESLDFIEHHHERMNGTGFPSRKSEKSLSEVAQIANIIVTFEALTSESEGKSKLVSNEAIRKMKGWEGQFNMELLEKFQDFSRQFHFKPKD